MKNMAILIDVNVILDFILCREPFNVEARTVMGLCDKTAVHGYIAFHSVSIVWYSLRRYISDKAKRREVIKSVLEILNVVGADHNAVLDAINQENFDDFEDCLQSKCAETVRADYIVTNNVRDFKLSAVPTITPADFCKLMT